MSHNIVNNKMMVIFHLIPVITRCVAIRELSLYVNHTEKNVHTVIVNGPSLFGIVHFNSQVQKFARYFLIGVPSASIVLRYLYLDR